ncbi:serine/threonine-protein kinase [Paraliomyxa miuraensis]|uniref:serine/threonine-protein kinase n=1 Tax=Paraliomyxa miuraensis TaxID=376150 RepID=UPI0022562994|nr:serine/threonine-protein kinase [Paraliomyxa miuraensis]MCX4241395.1 serine/threonine-protein kinase [Paraliomyxa miuraensis]
MERAHARAKLKAQLFQVESEPLRIGRFPILGRLGQGGMGTVFSAYDEELDRKIAVKVMRAVPGSGGTQGRERLRREAQAMARLSHPNIVAVHEVGEVDRQVFIAMEFVRGSSLDAWLIAEPRPLATVLEVFLRAGRGLAAAHEAGLVHRDFKPSNVMVGDDGQVKILDFGLARDSNQRGGRSEPPSSREDAFVEPHDRSLTRTGAIVGTPAFMAPEQHRGEPATAKSDQWSFCVALYSALYGIHPFPVQTLPALVAAICDGAPVEAPKDTPVPAWVRRVVLRGLSRAPAERHPSMAALLEALAADPGARRRRWVVRVAALGVLFGGGFGVAQLTEREPCPDGREALLSAWDDARRTRVATALRDGAPHGDDTWARVEPALDAYADAWVSSRHEACQVHRSGTVSDLLYERRLACLSRSRSALDALVEVFEQADATVVEKAVSAVTGLPAIARCEDAEALLADVEPPSEAIAAEVASLRDRLARARSVEDAGRLQESIAAAEQVLARAEQLDYPPLVAEALLRRGTGQLLAGEGAAADQNLGTAAWIAIDCGHDEVAAEAATRKIYVRSEQLGKPAEAKLELPWARALVEHTNDDALLGLFLHNAAAVEIRTPDLDQARALARQSLETRQRFLPHAHPEIALTLANLGHIERDMGDHASALETLREAMHVTEIALGPRHPQRAMIATIRGTTLLDGSRHAEARRDLELAETIYRESLGSQAIPLYHVLHALGRLALLERRWGDARRLFDEALALAEPQVGTDHPMLANTRLALAELEAATGDPTVGEAMGRAAQQQLEAALGPTHPYVASAWLRLGRLLLAAGVLDRAEECVRHAVEIESLRAATFPSGVELAGLWLARIQAARGEHDTAIARLEGHLEALAASVPNDSVWVLDGRAALADAWLEAGDPHRAAELLGINETILAGIRSEGDPESTWLRARRAHLRASIDSPASTRATLEHATAVLEAHPAYAAEAQAARDWLAEIGRPSP